MNAKTRRAILIVAAITLFSSAFRLSFIHFTNKLDYKDFSPAGKGILDLRGVSFPHGKTLRLDGAWEFYPSCFFYEDKPGAASYSQVPGLWNKDTENQAYRDVTYGSYRLKILLDDPIKDPLALRIERVSNAYRLFINGNLTAENGIVSVDPVLHQNFRMPRTVELSGSGGSIELVFEVSNSAAHGGITAPIRLGTHTAIHRRVSFSIGLQVFAAAICLLHSLYAIAFYFLRMNNRGLLYFSMLMFFTAASILTKYDKVLLSILNPGFAWHMKLGVLFYNTSIMLIPLTIYFFVGKPLPIRVMRVYAFSALAAVSDLYWATKLPFTLLLLCFMLASVFLTLLMLFRAVQTEAQIDCFLVASTFLCMEIFWTILTSVFSLTTLYYPFDLLFAVVFFIVFWLKRYADNLTRMKRLADREVAWLQSQM